MSDPYEEFADVFMGTLAGAATGLNREQCIAAFKAKFPDPEEFKRQIADMNAQAAKLVEQAQAQLKPGEVLAVGYPITESAKIVNPSSLH